MKELILVKNPLPVNIATKDSTNYTIQRVMKRFALLRNLLNAQPLPVHNVTKYLKETRTTRHMKELHN